MLRIGKKILKIIGYIIGGILLLLLIIALVIQTPPVQNFLKDKALTFFKEKVNTEADIGRFSLSWPDDLVVEQLYIEDQQGDTLAYVNKLYVGTNMWGLLKGELDISSIELEGFVGYMSRNAADSAFNFDFIIEAFATDSIPADTTVEKTPSTFDITVNSVIIDNSRFYYKDPISGFDMWYSIGNFEVEISEFDLNKSIYHISEVALSDSYGEFIQTKDVPPSEEESEPFALDLKVEDVTIERVKFFFETIPGELKLASDIGSLTGTLDELDLLKMNYSAKELHLANSLVEIDITGPGNFDSLQQEAPSALDTVVLNVFSESITFENANFRFDDHTAPEAPGFDPMHFAFTNIDAEFKEPRYRLEGEDSYAYGTVENLTAEESAGMALTKTNGVVEFTPTHTVAKDFAVVAGQSNISGDFRISYSSLEAMAETPGHIGLSVDMAPSIIHLNDVLYFVPDMRDQIAPLPRNSRAIRMEGELEGKVAALDIGYFHLEGLKNTVIDVKGHLAGIPDVNNLYADFKLSRFKTTRADLETVLPDTLIPPTITLPELMAVEGTFKGDMQQAITDLEITTSMGNASIDATLKMGEDSVYSYTGQLVLNEFNVGQLLQQEEMMGPLSLDITADGKGFTMEELNTELEGQVSAFTYNNYTYNNLKVNGMFFKKEFSGKLAMDDENLDFTFEGTVDLNDSIPAFMFFLDLETIDLHALNFVEQDLRIEAEIDSDLRASSLEQIRGHVGIDNMVVYQNEKSYEVDSLIFRSMSEGDETIVTISSNILGATFKGEFEVVNLPLVIQAHINQYYDLMDTTSIEGIDPQSFTFNIDIRDTELLTEVLVPDLNAFETGEISGSYDSEDWMMDIKIEVWKVDYAGIELDTLITSVTSDEEELNYDLRLSALHTVGFPIRNIWVEGVVASNHINTALHIVDADSTDKYLFGGIFTTWEEHYYQLQLTPGRLIMDYEEWEVFPGNSIRFFPSGIIIEDLRLTYEDQKWLTESMITEEQDTLISMDFTNFELTTLTDMAAVDTTLLSGNLNGSLELNTSAETFAFTSDMGIRHLSYKRDTLGNLSLNAYSSAGERYNVTASLDGEDNQVLVEGYYDADSTTGILHFDADLEALDFTTVEALSMGELSESRGYLTGDLEIRGTVNDPLIRGSLGFQDVATKLTFTRSWMIIDDEEIKFDSRGLHFANFTINDGGGNDFNINGDVLTDDYEFFRFSLNGRMRDFLLMNSGAGDNPLVYGSLTVDSDLRVTGNSDLPVINMDINLNNESRVTYIVPEAQLTTIEREGLIEFIDMSEYEKDPRSAREQISDTLASELQGVSFTANINVDPSVNFTIVIDPATGDRLSDLQGVANLALNINPTGDISLNGRYTVNQGIYAMRFFGLARREFNIVEGSYLLWTGDPLNARIDIRAQYQVLASPQPLVETLGTTGSQYAKSPILVYLDLEGRLLNPEIAFQLSMPEDERRGDVMALLQEINTQESRLLEEVLSLVVFRRFSGGNILGGGGGGPESTARQSVSRVLSQQLNQLGSQIQGVNISFDVQSYQDYSQTGDPYNRTQVELGLSKQFFNNRVNVKVAGNFDVEGERAKQQQNMNDFAGDIIIEYLITRDGRFRLMGFRENEYDDLLQGEIVETGIGVIFVKDYDSLKELFADLNNDGG